MTRVDIKWKGIELYIEVEGHSSADAGEDNLVCAAVSVLVQSMMQMFRNLTELGFISRYEEKVQDGYAKFRIIPSNQKKYFRIWDMMVVPKTGFELLAEAHPDKVCIGWGNKKSKCDNMKSRHSGETVLDAQERL